MTIRFDDGKHDSGGNKPATTVATMKGAPATNKASGVALFHIYCDVVVTVRKTMCDELFNPCVMTHSILVSEIG